MWMPSPPLQPTDGGRILRDELRDELSSELRASTAPQSLPSAADRFPSWASSRRPLPESGASSHQELLARPRTAAFSWRAPEAEGGGAPGPFYSDRGRTTTKD